MGSLEKGNKFDFDLAFALPGVKSWKNQIEPEIPLWCFNMYRWNNFEQLGATLVISGIFIGCLRFYGALIG